jgi:hypothetical protein
MKESEFQKRVMLELSANGDTVFRNHVGMGVFGKIDRNPHGVYVHQGRVLQCGLHQGSGDLIGWRPVTVTQDMVGKTVAVFLSVEVKTANGRLRPEQKAWMEAVNKAGGIAVIERAEHTP